MGPGGTWCERLRLKAGPIGPFEAIARYWYTAPRGRKDNSTDDPTWAFALGWNF